ncbi:MAG: hypothetical protein RL329_3245 [Bacteroidota bacterium]|jgi:hypothetical protein
MRKEIQILVFLGIWFLGCKSRVSKGEKIGLPTPLPKNSSGVSAPKPLRDKSIFILEEEQRYDPQNSLAIRDSVLVFRWNEPFWKEMSEPEKAVLAYIATFADGDNCNFSAECDGKNGIQCKLVTAIGLGCQCSTSHLDFLRQWFDPKVPVLEDGHCYQRPLTASRRVMFSQIHLTVKGNLLTVTYKGSGMTGEDVWQFEGTEIFQLQGHQLKVIDSKQSTLNPEKDED